MWFDTHRDKTSVHNKQRGRRVCLMPGIPCKHTYESRGLLVTLALLRCPSRSQHRTVPTATLSAPWTLVRVNERRMHLH